MENKQFIPRDIYTYISNRHNMFYICRELDELSVEKWTKYLSDSSRKYIHVSDSYRKYILSKYHELLHACIIIRVLHVHVFVGTHDRPHKVYMSCLTNIMSLKVIYMTILQHLVYLKYYFRQLIAL